MSEPVALANDVCALSIVRRMAAMLDRQPGELKEGHPLPRGWHVALFNPPTRQSDLRADGSANLGVSLPDLGMPRLMMAGRRIDFVGDIPIGAPVRRASLLGTVTHKTGKSGRFALVDVEHRITVGDRDVPAVIETNSYVMREAITGSPINGSAVTVTPIPPAEVARIFVPDETTLFRYSAITDNPHRIHYDLAYAQSEGYPALVVNGTIPTMFLLEIFREQVGAEPAGWLSRNIAPILCGEPLRLTLSAAHDGWIMHAYGPTGVAALEARAWT